MESPIEALLDRPASPDAPTPAENQALAAEDLHRLTGLEIYPASIAAADAGVFCLGKDDRGRHLVVATRRTDVADRFAGHRQSERIGGAAATVILSPLSSDAMAALRESLPFLKAVPLGLRQSAGCGDRLGLATPGHVRAIRKTELAPILAQQSVRENERTGRSPQTVLDDAAWGVFQEGWRDGFGADADHLKTPDAMDAFVAAGYSFFTVDPGDHVDGAADRDPPEALGRKIDALPWTLLDSSPSDLMARLAGRPVDLDGLRLLLTEADLARAAVKYGRVVAHTAAMFQFLTRKMNGRPFEFEVSVDETDTVTSLAEHVYLAAELRRLGVSWVSLAPRYVGAFEKGVDYIGDLAAFEAEFARHAAVARVFGPYKLSLHSGSDKFAVYPIAAKCTRGMVHLKTAGTSYLEALRAIATAEPPLFRRILDLAVERYPVDRATYHVSADAACLTDHRKRPDAGLPQLLDDVHCRQILHVTYGSVLNRPDLRKAFFAVLQANVEAYNRLIETHFDRHFRAFAGG